MKNRFAKRSLVVLLSALLAAESVIPVSAMELSAEEEAELLLPGEAAFPEEEELLLDPTEGEETEEDVSLTAEEILEAEFPDEELLIGEGALEEGWEEALPEEESGAYGDIQAGEDPAEEPSEDFAEEDIGSEDGMDLAYGAESPTLEEEASEDASPEALVGAEEQTTLRSGYYYYQVTDGEVCITDVEKADIVNSRGKVTGQGKLQYESVVIPATLGGYPVTSIGDGVFKDAKNLQKVSFPDSLKEIGRRAFCNCKLLDQVTLPAGLTSLSCGAFEGCTSLSGINIPLSARTGDYVTNYGYPGPFTGCTSLRRVDFAEGMVIIPRGLFYGCTGLEEIAIPETVTEIEYAAFMSCSNLKKVSLPTGLLVIGEKVFRDCKLLEDTALPEGLTQLGNGAFMNCTSFTKINIPPSVRTDAYCGEGSGFPGPFYGCSSLQEVTFPKGITSIPNGLFSQCTGLVDFTLPGTVGTIESGAFNGCTELQTIHLGSALLSVESSAFRYCDALTDVYYAASGADWEEISISRNNDPLQKATLHTDEAHPIRGLKIPLTFNANGGTVKSGSKKVKTLTVQVVADSKPDAFPVPARSGYLFLGWFTTKTGGTKKTASQVIKASMTLYAHWIKMDLAKATVSIPQCRYTGKALKPAVTVKLGGVLLKKGTDYTVAYSNNKEPGTGKVTLTGKGSYKKSKKRTVTFKILRAKQTITLSRKKVENSYDKLGAVITIKASCKGGAVLSYSTGDKKVAAQNKTKNKFTLKAPGKTTITVSAKKTRYYEAASATVTVIQKGKQSVSISASSLKVKKDKKTGKAIKDTYTMKASSVPVSLTIKREGSVGYTSSVQNVEGGGATISGNKLTAPYAGTIKVKVTTKETEVYPSASKTITVEITGVAKGSIDTSKEWNVSQNADGTFTILRYLGNKKELSIPSTLKVGVQTQPVTRIGDSAFLNKELTRLDLGTSSVTVIGREICKGMKTLQIVRMPASLTEIGEGAFSGCTGLKEIFLSDKIRVIEKDLLLNCKSLTELTIPASVKTIGEAAFKGCKGLKRVSMPVVTSLGKDAFAPDTATALTDLYFGGSAEEFRALVASSAGNDRLSRAKLHPYSFGAAVPAQTGISREELFSSYSAYLKNEDFFYIVSQAEEAVRTRLYGLSWTDTSAAAMKTQMKKGLRYTISALLEDGLDLNWTEDKLNEKLAMDLLQMMTEAPDYEEAFQEAYQAHLSGSKKSFDVAATELAGQLVKLADEVEDPASKVFKDGDTRWQFSRQVAAAFNEAGESREDASSINEALAVIGNQWDTISQVIGYADKAADVVDFLFLMETCRDLDLGSIQALMEMVPKDSGLYRGLTRLYDRQNSTLAFYAAEYVQERFLKELAKTFTKTSVNLINEIWGHKKAFKGDTVIWAAEHCLKAMSYAIDGPEIDVYNGAWVSLVNTGYLRTAVEDRLAEMTEAAKSGTLTEAQSSAYQQALVAYLFSLEQAGSKALGTYKGTERTEKAILEERLARLKNVASWENYLNWCEYNVLAGQG